MKQKTLEHASEGTGIPSLALWFPMAVLASASSSRLAGLSLSSVLGLVSRAFSGVLGMASQTVSGRPWQTWERLREPTKLRGPCPWSARGRERLRKHLPKNLPFPSAGLNT